MRRSPREQFGDVGQADAVFGFELCFPDPVLLGMVEAAKAEAPAVRWLECGSTIGSGSDMGALDRQPLAAGNRTVVAPDPGAMSRADARWRLRPWRLDPVRQAQGRHWPSLYSYQWLTFVSFALHCSVVAWVLPVVGFVI